MKSKTPTKKSGKNSYFFVGLALCLCLGLGGGVFAYQRHLKEVELIKKERIAAEIKAQEDREKRRAEIQALFDAYLNAFKGELIEKAKTYKNTRKILQSLIRPGNYKDIESAKENYFLFKESLAPTLRKQSVDIIGIFERYSEKIKRELSTDENGLQKIFLKQWEEMTQEQIVHYIDFFSNEEELIQAYDKLITFYYTHSKRYVVNEFGTSFDFSSPDDEAKAEFLLEQVKMLQKPAKDK